jgi:O-antigen/teichoic acid export membrane protein
MKFSGAGARSIFGNAVYLFGSQLATMLARGVYVVVLARALGPESFGVFNYALAWYLLFISLTYLGLDAWLIRELATDKAKAPESLRKTLLLRTAAALVVAAVSCLLAGLVESSPEVWLLHVIFAFALIGRALWIWAVSAFTAFERTRFAMHWDAVFRPIEIVVALAILAWRPNLQWLAASHALLWWIQAAVGVHTVSRRLAPLADRVSIRSSLELLAQTWPAGLYTIVICVFMQAPIVIMRLIEPDASRLGEFALAYQACMYFLIAPYLISSVMLPVISRASARGDGKDVGIVSLMVRATSIFGAALVIVFGPAIASLAELLFGARYAATGELLRAALWLAIPFSAVNFLLPLFFARSAYRPVGVQGVLGVAVMLGAMSLAATRDVQAVTMLAVGAGMSAWLLLMLAATRTHVPSFDRKKSIGAFALACITFAVHAVTAAYGMWAQAGVSLAVLALGVMFLGFLSRQDVRLLGQVISGTLGSDRT